MNVAQLGIKAKLGDAAARDPAALCHLGVHYINGSGVRRNPSRAVSLYRQAADGGYDRACHLLGLCYQEGEGVKKIKRWARHWFEKAASMGVKEARRDLNRMG